MPLLLAALVITLPVEPTVSTPPAERVIAPRLTVPPAAAVTFAAPAPSVVPPVAKLSVPDVGL